VSADVPYDWIRAVVVAWPLASDAGFESRLTALTPATASSLGARLEEWLRPRARGVSLDTLRLTCELAWQRRYGTAPTLARYVCGIAGEYLAWEGDGVRLHGIDDTPVLAGQWRWLSLSLPSDLLVAALAADAGTAPPSEHIRLLSRAADVLFGESPFAATHLHVGAALTFRLVWSSLMRAVADEPIGRLDFKAGGPPPFGSPDAFCTRLLQAGIVRTLLASFLWSRSSALTETFTEFLGDARRPGRFDLGAIARRFRWQQDSASVWSSLGNTIRSLVNGGEPPAAADLQRLYRRLIGAPSPNRARSVDDLAMMDPLAEWQRPSPAADRTGADSAETHLATQAIRYMLARPSDDVFATTFWQYERVRTLAFRYLVEEPGTAGLDWFSRHYQRISPMRRACEDILYQSALQVEGQGIALGALEARTRPESDWSKIRDEVRKVARNALAHRLPQRSQRSEIGLVFHFVKLREGSRDGRSYRHADPRQPAFGCRFGNWFNDRTAESQAMIRAMRLNPEILAILRGVDIANLELAVPTWPVLPLMSDVREASRGAVARLAQQGLDWRAAPLRVTYHAGEDFGRLSHGLRLIDEPIDFRVIGAGDRIGHAVALGVDVERWANTSACTVQVKEDRLDDLLWELERYRRGEIDASAGRIALVQAEAERLSSEIFDVKGLRIDVLIEARHRRHSAADLRTLGYPRLGLERPAALTGAESAIQLLRAYLIDPNVYDRGQTPMEVPLHESEIAFLKRVQSWLRRRLGALAVTVETNPSSNLLIGDLGDIERHPALSLYPLNAPTATQGPTVSISINTDNPLTFASCLGDEFAHFHHALVRRGVSSVDAMRWLDDVREQGWRSRFTLPASASEAVLEQILDRAERPQPPRTWRP